MIAKFGVFQKRANNQLVQVKSIKFSTIEGKLKPSDLEMLMDYDKNPDLVVLTGNRLALQIWKEVDTTKLIKRAWFSQ